MTKKQAKYQFNLAVLAVVFSALAVLFLNYYSKMGSVAGVATGF